MPLDGILTKDVSTGEFNRGLNTTSLLKKLQELGVDVYSPESVAEYKMAKATQYPANFWGRHEKFGYWVVGILCPVLMLVGATPGFLLAHLTGLAGESLVLVLLTGMITGVFLWLHLRRTIFVAKRPAQWRTKQYHGCTDIPDDVKSLVWRIRKARPDATFTVDELWQDRVLLDPIAYVADFHRPDDRYAFATWGDDEPRH